MANRKLIYTVCTNNYDQVKPPKVYFGYDYWLFTDDPYLQVKGWQTKVIAKSEGCKLQREIKIRSCEYTKGYDLTIYHDANIELINNPNQLINQFFRGGILTCTHWGRSNVRQEGDQIIKLGKDAIESVEATLEAVSDCLVTYGLWATGILIRDKSVRELEECWWSMVRDYSHRDQLTLPYASWKTNTPINGIRRALMYSFFGIQPGHKSSARKDRINVWYSNPYSIEKNIGKAYNDFIKQLNPSDEDWIVMQDGDMMYLTPDWGKRIHEALLLEGHNYGLIGCYTNRLKGLHQLHDRRFSDDTNIKNHYEIANSYEGNHIIELKKEGVAGVFMAFQMKTWKAVKGFREDSISFDTSFNQAVRALGMKVGLINSLYVFHLYRIWAEKEPWNEKKHLQ